MSGCRSATRLTMGMGSLGLSGWNARRLLGDVYHAKGDPPNPPETLYSCARRGYGLDQSLRSSWIGTKALVVCFDAFSRTTNRCHFAGKRSGILPGGREMKRLEGDFDYIVVGA